MKKTYLALALLITGFLLAGDAYGEDEVYYCAEIGHTGHFYDKELNNDRSICQLQRDNKSLKLKIVYKKPIY